MVKILDYNKEHREKAISGWIRIGTKRRSNGTLPVNFATIDLFVSFCLKSLFPADLCNVNCDLCEAFVKYQSPL